MTNILSFPGLGIEGIRINPVAFNILGKDVMWYGIIITCGIIVGYLYTSFRGTKYEGISSDDVLDITIYTVVFAILGARAYYVLTRLENYHSFYDVIAIWNGGIAIYGAIIAGFLTILIVTRIKKIKLAKMIDATSPGVMLGQIIGRWGNFCNAEAFGRETDLPWRMGITNLYHPETICVHPTFLYESLWNLLGFLIINAVYKRKKFDGQIFLMYASWYGFGRFFIEGLRTDSLYVGSFRVSQLVGAGSFVVCVILLLVFSFRADHLAKLAEQTEAEEDGASTLISEDAPSDEESAPDKPENVSKEPPETEETGKKEPETPEKTGKKGNKHGSHH